MTTLKIFLFGGMRVIRSDCQDQVDLTLKLRSLLAFLVLQRHRSHPRETLMEIFWRDMDEASANKCLSTAMWRLRHAIERESVAKGSYLLTDSTTHSVGFNPESDFWLDAKVFEHQAAMLRRLDPQYIGNEIVEDIENSLTLYSNGLLNDFYDDWAIREHERFRDMYIFVLRYLMAYHTANRSHAKALDYGRLLLEQDPLREDVQRGMMHLYVVSGQRTLAVRQYECFRRVLAAELQIAPSEETEALYREITGTSPPDIQAGMVSERSYEHSQLSEVIVLLKQAQSAVDSLHRQLQTIETRLDHNIKPKAHT